MKNEIAKVVKKVSHTVSKNSPAILTGLAIAGVVSTTVLAVRATPKALQLIEVERQNQEADDESGCIPELSKVDIVKTTWKCYIPAALMGGATIACVIGANTISTRRNAALAGVYTLTEAALKEYQAKVVETIGETKNEKIKDEIAKERIQANPVGANEVIITGNGEMLCYDVLSGRYFKNDIENIRKLQNELNRDLLNQMFISLNDVYYALGLANTKMGNELGWSVEDGLIDFDFRSQLTEDGVPCLVIDYKVGPTIFFDA